MTTISRRGFLVGLGSIGLAAAVSQSFTSAAFAADPLTTGDYESLRTRWVDLITGRSLIDPSIPVFGAALASLDAGCADILAHVVTAPDRTQIFDDNVLSDDAAMTASFKRLQTLATAWATPGSAFHQSIELRDTVVLALKDLNRLVYYVGRRKTGNWWSWEIGSSKALADTMAVFRDHIDQADLTAYCAAIDHFVPDPWKQQSGIVSTGANRVDLCQAVIIRSIVMADDQRLNHAIEGLSATWQYVTKGDGFFRDGSYIQHSNIGYTGTYGIVLLSGLSLMFALLSSTSHDITDPTRSIIDDAIEGSYAPLVYRGQMMDAVRGRAISREGERSFQDGDATIEAVLRLALAVDPLRASRWRGLCLQWIEAARTGTAQHDILTSASIVRTALVNDLINSGTVPREDAGAGRLFPGMDRLVHRGVENSWALTVAMCSRRITWYECGNNENNLGAQTSSGMTYLYLNSDDAHFDDGFWPTSDLAAPPGTTVDTLPLPPKVEGEWGARMPQNEWTGGSVLEEWSLAGQHLIGPGSTGLSARKSWFAGPDFIACLGADITCIPRATVDHKFTTVADSHVNDGAGKATTNYGSAGTLLVKTVASAGSGYTRQTYLKFTPDAVADLASVSLFIRARVNDGGGTSDVIAVHRTGDFEESTLTWNNRPAAGDLLGTITVSGGWDWRSVDLTATLRDQVIAGQAVTLVLTEDLAGGRSQGLSIEISSKEAGDAPYLGVGTSASATGRTKSVVEHRNTGENPAVLIVDGEQVTDKATLQAPAWAHVPGTAGYVFLAPATVNASVGARTGTWRGINAGGSTAAVTRNYATLEVQHPGTGTGDYAYLVLPAASEDGTRSAAAKPPVTVVANTADVQALATGKVTAANFWRPGSAAGISVDGAACVIARRTPGMAAVAVSDPTQTATSIVVAFADAPWTRVVGDRVSMRKEGKTVYVTVDVSGAAGVPVGFRLHRG